MLLLRLFGGAGLEDASGPVSGRAVQPRRLALLAILALEHPRVVSRDKLVAWLWPERETERARHLLRDSLYLLRNSLGDDALLSGGDELRLNPHRFRCDVWEFEEALGRGELEAATRAYGGPLLDGFHVSDAPELGHWLDTQRERLARAYAQTLERLAEKAGAESDPKVAVEWWRRLAALEPYDARLTRRLMEALDASGNRAGALQQARTHALLLEQEFGAEPDPEIRSLAERLRTAPADRALTASAVSGKSDTGAGASKPDGRQPGVPSAASALHTDRDLSARTAGATPAAPTPARRRAPGRAVALPAAAGVGLAGVLSALLLLPGGDAPDAAEPSTSVSTKAIAVLPCANLSGDPEQEYFSDGLTEELTGSLSQVHSLKVVARTSAFAFKGQNRDVREVGELLKVGTVLECSVRRAGERVRVTAQLINARDGFHLWTGTYDREGTDLIAIQSDLALKIAAALEAELTPMERARLARRATDNPAAHTLYQKGRFFWNQRTGSGYARAIEYYEQAIEADSRYAEAYAGLATVYSMQGIFGIATPEEAAERTRDYALKALALDADVAEAHTVMGGYYQAHAWDSDAAEREHLRALELDPNYSTAHFWYGNFLTAMRRHDQAIAHKQKAVELDPLSPQLSWALGLSFLVARRYHEALEQFGNAIELDSSYTAAYTGMGDVYEAMGQLDEALRVNLRAAEIDGWPSPGLARVLARSGRKEEARRILVNFQVQGARTGIYFPFIATVFAALDDLDGAISWLERSYEQRHPALRFIDGPGFAPLEGDPRYHDLRRRIGLPQ
jgi:TolB-like protein/DNA-binding SARP family transcriptional activator/Tfp pilus assembly protein PilF